MFHEKQGRKRLQKSADRTHAWLRDMISSIDLRSDSNSKLNIFAAVLPYSKETQSLYLQDLEEEYRDSISGLALSSISNAECIPESLVHLPRLLMQDIKSPSQILDAVAVGCDLMTFSLCNQSSDAGLAFTFRLHDHPSESKNERLPLALDMWASGFATDIGPLTEGCQCYTCTRHHRAYLHHLLQAKEMLAWTLLQIHNHAMMDSFFASIRASITLGTFDIDCEKFNRQYELEMPAKTGQGPRVRGYQIKTERAGEPRKNPKAYGRLDDQIQKLAEAESGIPTPTEDSQGLEETGFAQKTEHLA